MPHSHYALPFVLVLAGCAVIPEGSQPGVTFSSEIASQNNLRGMVNADSPVLRTGVDVSVPTTAPGGTLTVSTLATWDLANDVGNAWFPGGHAGEYSQIDLGLIYSETFRGFEFASGLFSYALQNPDDFPFAAERGETKEIFFQVARPLEHGIVPSLLLQYDIDEVHSLYATAGLAKLYRKNRFSSEFKLTLSYAGEGQSEWIYGLAESGFADAGASARMTFDLDPHTTFSLGAQASSIVDTDIERWLDVLGIESNNFWITAGFVWSY